MGDKKLVKDLIKKLDKLESEREKLIDKLAKALDKLEKKGAAKNPVVKKVKAPSKKTVIKKVATKKATAKKAPKPPSAASQS